MKLLFEIGLEELPSGLILKAINDLEEIIKNEFKNKRIKYEKITKYSTPRRLAVIVDGILEKQETLDEFKIGPSYDLCYKDGKLTIVGEKFLKSQNSTESSIEIVENERGKYIGIRKYEEGQLTKLILPEILKNTLYSLEFERNMKWGDTTFRFIRPIKWIVSIFDDEVVNFEFEKIKSSNITRGMRVVGSQNIQINDISMYQKLLEENYVIPDRDKRKNLIVEEIRNRIDTEDEITIIPEKLLEEIVDLVEYPYPIKAKFNEKFLELPEEIITITMETHQRYFPVRDKNNKLTNKFVLVRNNYKYSEAVKLGNEKVIEPRLADAQFFFNEDVTKPLINNVEKLKKVIFQKDMGTIYDKVERMHKIADFLMEKLNISNVEDVHTTIELSKADLVSNVISEKEFTQLQGYMGSIYARKQGYNEEISIGIREHYRPYTFDEKLTTITGKITSIADKLDSLVGCFLVGLVPTSSKDPFALRRACVGIISVLKDMKANISYVELIEKMIEIFSEKVKILNEKAKEQILELFEDRLVNSFIRDNKDSSIKLIIENDKNIKNLIEKEYKISLDKDNFNDLISIIRRLKNVSKDSSYKFNKEEIGNSYEQKMAEILENIDKLEFSTLIDYLINNKGYINEFFENVKVNEKENRKALVKKVYDKINSVLNLNI